MAKKLRTKTRRAENESGERPMAEVFAGKSRQKNGTANVSKKTLLVWASTDEPRN
jgi:hypothetical protein